MKFKLLLIDESESFCEGVRQELEKTGLFCVGIANDGQTALRMAQKGFPNMILLAERLPDMSGNDIIGNLSKDASLSKVLVIRLADLPAAVAQWPSWIESALLHAGILPAPVAVS